MFFHTRSYQGLIKTDRLLAGVSMFTIGLFYMALGHRVTGLSPTGRDLLTKLILGIQVGIVGLSVLVTLSSVQSLKEKRGLPLGNQIVGWIVLGMQFRIKTNVR